MKSEVYKMRAECIVDVARFMEQAGGQFETIEITKLKIGPDVEVKFKTKMSPSYIARALEEVSDGHVMLETFAPLKLYDGVRRRAGL